MMTDEITRIAAALLTAVSMAFSGNKNASADCREMTRAFAKTGMLDLNGCPTHISFTADNKHSIVVGEKLTLKCTVNSNATKRGLVWYSSNSAVAEVKNGSVYARSPGSTVIVVCTENNMTDRFTVNVRSNNIKLENKMRTSYTVKNFHTVKQLPELPTGCEITALTQTLNFYGYKVSKTAMADKYLDKAPFEATDFNTAFMSSPYSAKSYGCYAPVIVRAANKYFDAHDNKHVAQNYTGTDIKTVYRIVNEGYPVIVWATADLKEPKRKLLWEAKDSGKPVYWLSGEHCLTLVGFDIRSSTVTLCDPLEGRKIYPMAEFELRYRQLGKQAVIIKKVKDD